RIKIAAMGLSISCLNSRRSAPAREGPSLWISALVTERSAASDAEQRNEKMIDRSAEATRKVMTLRSSRGDCPRDRRAQKASPQLGPLERAAPAAPAGTERGSASARWQTA